MELKYLNTVKTILETGSFQNAARKLNYTQSTVTFQIQQLEQELNVKLFEKIGRKMVMTQAGKDIMPYIETILDTACQLSNYGKSVGELTGTLKVGFPESLLVYKMPMVLAKFRKAAPNVQLSLQIANCYEINDAIAKGALDVGIHYTIKPNPVIVTEKILSYPFALIAAPVLSKKEQDFIHSGQLKETSLIYSDVDCVYEELFNKYLNSKNITMNSRILIQSIEAIKLCVMSNIGVAFLPRFTVEKELAEQKLQEIKTDMKEPEIFSMISYHKNKWISPAMELFVRMTKECLCEEEI